MREGDVKKQDSEGEQRKESCASIHCVKRTLQRNHSHQGWQGEGISNKYLLGEEKPSGISTLSFTAQMHLKVWTLPNFVNDSSKAVITIRFKECKIKLQIFPERSSFLDA